MENAKPTVLQENIPTAVQLLPYSRQYVIIAVYEILDKYGARYEKENSSTVFSEITVYGNQSLFCISVNAHDDKTELRVAMVQPCSELSFDGMKRSVTAVTDSITQYLENEMKKYNSEGDKIL